MADTGSATAISSRLLGPAHQDRAVAADRTTAAGLAKSVAFGFNPAFCGIFANRSVTGDRSRRTANKAKKRLLGRTDYRQGERSAAKTL